MHFKATHALRDVLKLHGNYVHLINYIHVYLEKIVKIKKRK